MSTRQRILDLLNRQEHSVQELSQALGISRNSVHVQVVKLEAAGIVEKFHRGPTEGVGSGAGEDSGQVPRKSSGKPAYYFRLVAGHEDASSSAYRPVSAGLIGTLSRELSEEVQERVLERTGRSLAQDAGLSPGADFRQDLAKSVAAVNELGTLAEIQASETGARVVCHSCPIAALVHESPKACQLVAAFFSEATGRRVEVECRHEPTVVCGFSFEPER